VRQAAALDVAVGLLDKTEAWGVNHAAMTGLATAAGLGARLGLPDRAKRLDRRLLGGRGETLLATGVSTGEGLVEEYKAARRGAVEAAARAAAAEEEEKREGGEGHGEPPREAGGSQPVQPEQASSRGGGGGGRRAQRHGHVPPEGQKTQGRQ
jgi:hypothetical protein